MRISAGEEIVLATRGLTKRFGSFTANDGLDLDFRRGEIHAILGENGAGKSTLMNMLSGLIEPDGGEIRLNGASVRFGSPRAAMRAGIGMVHQHFMLVPALTAAENVLIGLKQGRGPLLRKRQACRDIAELSERYGLRIDPARKVQELSVGQQQRVEIVKTLYRGAEFIILDEPTAVLTPLETEELMAILRGLREQGKTIVFISHKLQEVMGVCDRVSVLRAGRLVASRDVSATSAAELASLMVGRELKPVLPRTAAREGKVRLAMRDVHAEAPGGQSLRGVSLELREGEILGIAGVDGNGQRELCEVLLGLLRRTGGQVELGGASLERPNPRRMAELGVGYIPEDRHREGLCLDLTIGESLIAKSYRSRPFSRFGLLRPRKVREAAEQAVHSFRVRTPGLAAPVRALSGGNQQKVVLARELMLEPSLLLAMQPTRGMDVGAAEQVHARLLAERERGCAVLLLSTELEEVRALSDRIAVLFKGRLVGVMARGEFEAERIGLWMAGLDG
ncbi:ABC transporter ATP-binding protein [Paenibacillus albicereus]|uniref:ABC transporter ATP-binding protein n=1 Tax=Paenibacillus albicereus TaxID=2726185 RepID=A0A6H2GV01_9BACL|nr:ABC transporter ATP-binding protein [Paenibacillus albicereus]QJC51240.1 ABC transporter ATP-binding protein [Paenibacillus albicereus]